MAFDSLRNLVQGFSQDPQWQDHRYFHRLEQWWPQCVDGEIARHSRLAGVKNQILWIDTPSAVWSQTLTLQRYGILQKLNRHLQPPIKDLRFRVKPWTPREATSPQVEHPCALPPAVTKSDQFPAIAPQDDPQATVKTWIQTLQTRARYLPLCPRCQVPTPHRELEHWRMCALCWSRTQGTDHSP